MESVYDIEIRWIAFPLHPDTPPQELGKWAEEKGCGHDFHLAMFKAYFADGINIADTEKLVSICSGLGLDADAAGEVIASRAYREQVDHDWKHSRELGITAVPTFRVEHFNLVGAQPYGKLAELLDGQQVPKRTSR